MALMKNKNIIKVGTIVKLKGGESPIMNVNIELENDLVECVWFNGNISKKEVYNKNVLYDYESVESANKMSKEELKNLSLEQLEKMYNREQKKLGIKE